MDPEQTIAVSLAARAAAVPSQAAHNLMPVGMPTSALPGYDAAKKEDGLAGQAGPGNNTCDDRPGAAERLLAGGGQAGQEP